MQAAVPTGARVARSTLAFRLRSPSIKSPTMRLLTSDESSMLSTDLTILWTLICSLFVVFMQVQGVLLTVLASYSFSVHLPGDHWVGVAAGAASFLLCS